MAKIDDWPEGKPPTKQELSWLRFKAMAKREADRISKLPEDNQEKRVSKILDRILSGKLSKEEEETAQELRRLKAKIKAERGED